MEVSLAGGFFPFLPSVNHHSMHRSVGSMMREMDASLGVDVGSSVADPAAAAACSPVISGVSQKSTSMTSPSMFSRQPSFRISVVTDDELRDMQRQESPLAAGRTVRITSLPVQFCSGSPEGYVSPTMLEDSRILEEKPREALLFIHGYNCSLETALGRLAQIMALGGMSPHIQPFVFSYSAGQSLTYFRVKRQMHEYASDLASVLSDLAHHFQEVHVLCHSSGAEFFLNNFHKAAGSFAPSRQRRESQRWQELRRAQEEQQPTSNRLQLATLTLMNPDVLVERVVEVLPGIMDYAEHFTTYNDTQDFALWVASLVQTSSCTCRADVFGTVAEPMQLVASGGVVTLQDPLLTRERRSSPSGSAASMGLLFGMGFWLEDTPDRNPWNSCIDVIDCSCIDQNVHNVRHNYYMLNTQMVEDVCELIGCRVVACNRQRLIRARANVYNFLSPPSYLTE